MAADARPTREDIIDRARAMVPLLREKALQAERGPAHSGRDPSGVPASRLLPAVPARPLRRLRDADRPDPLIGARGVNSPDSLFLLAWRDIHAAVSQITMAWDIQAVNAGRIEFGLPSLDPRL